MNIWGVMGVVLVGVGLVVWLASICRVAYEKRAEALPEPTMHWGDNRLRVGDFWAGVSVDTGRTVWILGLVKAVRQDGQQAAQQAGKGGGADG